MNNHAHPGAAAAVIALITSAATGLPRVDAADFMWTGSGDGFSFSDPSNWSPVGVPGQFDAVIFNIGFATTMDNFISNERLEVGGSGTLDLNGFHYFLAGGAPPTVGVTGLLDLINGTMNSVGDLDLDFGGTLNVTDVGWDLQGNSTIDGAMTYMGGNLQSSDTTIGALGSLSMNNTSWQGNAFINVDGSLALSSASATQGQVTIGQLGSVTVDNFSNLTLDGSVHMTGGATASSLAITNNSFVEAAGLSSDFNPGTSNITIQSFSGLQLTNPFQGTFLASATGSTANVTVTGPFSSWLMTADLVFGSGSMTMTVTDAFVECDASRIRPALGETADITVSGGQAGWVMSGEMDLGGDDGTTTMLIDNGAFVDASGAFLAEDSAGPTSLTVTGFDSEFFVFGELNVGNADLTASGGAIISSTLGLVGVGKSGSGDVTVTGLDSEWVNTGQVIVGTDTNGTLEVSAAASAIFGDVIIGFLPGSTGVTTVTGAGSAVIGLGDIDVGRFGQGTMTVDGGANVTSTNGYVGGFAGSVGSVTIDGAGTSWDTLGFVIIGGNAGTGSVVLSNGGALTAWQVSVGANGTLSVVSSASATAGVIDVADGGLVTGTGTLAGDVLDGGRVSPGESIGTLSVQGDYDGLVTGELAIDLAASGSDLLAVSGDVGLGGALELVVDPCDPPSLGQSFIILTGATVVGTFDSISSTSGQFDVIYGMSDVTVQTIAAPIPGDLNNDQSVDVQDLLALLAAWGPCPDPCPTYCAGDLDCNCDVGVTDLLALLANWN